MNKAQIEKIFESFRTKKIIVVGDVMLDSYLWGHVERISPEAPVPVVSVRKKENRLGGAANVALNVHALGATPYICSVTGEDDAGKTVLELLKKEQLPVSGIITSSRRTTTVKTRVIGNKHQMLRVDDETTEPLPAALTKELAGKIISLMNSEKADAVIFEDYDKGVISPVLIENVVKEAVKKKILTAADPKKKNFLHYRHITLFKPNLNEIRQGLKVDAEGNDEKSLRIACTTLHKQLGAGIVMITLSEKGVCISEGKSFKIIPAHIRNISDVSGAGDTVISAATLALTAGLPPYSSAALANLAGGLVCEKIGVVPVDRKLLIEEAVRMNIV